jgi:hypothetical protein
LAKDVSPAASADIRRSGRESQNSVGAAAKRARWSAFAAASLAKAVSAAASADIRRSGRGV